MLSISISLVAVFIPILLMGGIVGRLFREFAVTLSVAIVRLAGHLADHHADDVRQLLRPESEIAAWPALPRQRARLSAGFSTSTNGRCRWVLRHQSLMLLVTLGTIALNVYLYFVVPKGFFPQQDTGRLIGIDPGRPGHLVSGDEPRRLRICRRRQSRSRRRRRRLAFTGGGGGTHEHGPHVYLAEAADVAQNVSADQVIARLRPQTRRDRRGNAVICRPCRICGSAAGRSNAQYQYTLQGDDLRTLNDWAPQVLRRHCADTGD